MHVHLTERQQASLMFTQKLRKIFPAMSDCVQEKAVLNFGDSEDVRLKFVIVL